MNNIYLDEFERIAKQAYTMWNRDPASPSFGSFDRAFWGWKYKDFSDATLQYAVKLAVEYARRSKKTSQISIFLEGYVDFCKNIQLKDGSFNQCYPNERTPGIIYDILSVLIYVRQSPYLISQKAKSHLDGIITRAVSFALKADEKHGKIANHIAEYAYELLHYATYAEDQRALRKGEEYLKRLMDMFNDAEGWFLEYQGPDPGYQTRTLRYLVKCALINNKDELWDVIKKAANFIDIMLMPDGSIHPMLGSRSTAILYPSAFEMLAKRYDAYKNLASKVRNAWHYGRVPLPSLLDFDNAIRLADDAADAANIHFGNTAELPPDVVYTNGTETIDFPDAGIMITRESDRVIYIGYRIGGVIVIYIKGKDDQWKLLYEDSGYLLRSNKKDRAWVTRVPYTSTMSRGLKENFLIRADFYLSAHDELTPSRFILLRFLNMTILRSRTIGEIFRKIIVSRLIEKRKKIQVKLYRDIDIQKEMVRVLDRIYDERWFMNPSQRDSLHRCRRITGNHMASSRYFNIQELQKMKLDWMENIPWKKKRQTFHLMELSTIDSIN